VLIARGVLFIYDNNKSKIDKLISPGKPATEEVSMNLNEPASSTGMRSDSVATITFILTGDNDIYYYTGTFRYSFQKTGYDKVGRIIRQFKEKTDPDELMFIIKSTPESTFKNAIDILDQMTIENVPPGHYKETELTEEEINSINILKKSKNG
jgi:hypothetical protein